MTGQIPEDMLGGFCTEELECKICYCLYNLGARRPKVLECCHRLCAKCLMKITDLAESPPHAVVCPFCRCPTSLPGEEAGSLPDDCNIVAALALRGRHRQNLNNGSTELLLSPRRLAAAVSPSASYSSSSSSTSSYSSSTHGSSNCLVITIMETSQEPTEPRSSHPASMRDYRAPSPDSIASITRRWTVWNCTSMLCQTSAQALVWLLGLLYFSSLPLGVYLLIMQRTTLGVLLVSLVPSSLVVLMVYGFCQCICHEFWNCISS